MPALKQNSKKTTKKVAPRAGFNPVKDDTEESRASKVIWSTEALGAALEGLNQGYKLKANPFYENNTKLLKADLLFERTPEELEHYKVCMNDVLEFAKECQLMTPQGIQHVTLRDYQEDYLKHLQDNRLSIFLSCRQSGKCFCLADRVYIDISSISDKTNTIPDSILKKWNKNYYINDNEYELPVFELLNLFKTGLKWRITYHLYNLIYKLNVWKERNEECKTSRR